MDANVKCGAQNAKTKILDKKSKTETNFSSFGVDKPVKMIVIGKSIVPNKSRSVNSGYNIHECQSDTAINDNDQKNSLCNEEFNPSELSNISAPSFTSTKSDINTTEGLQEKVYNMECKIPEKNTTVCIFKKKLNENDVVTNYNTVAVETDIQSEASKSELTNLQIKLSDHEKTITKLSRELEENIEIKEKYIAENQNLIHEVNLLNKQLHSVYELVKSKNWNIGINPEEFKDCRTKMTELQLEVRNKEEIISRLRENIAEKENLIKLKDELLEETRKKFSEYERTSSIHITDLTQKICSLQIEAKIQEEIFNDKISKAQKNMEDDITCVIQKVEMQYQEELKIAIERCSKDFKKLSDMPKDRLDNIIKLCETGKIDVMTLRRDWEEERILFAKKINFLQEERSKEITCLVDNYESKIRNLKSEIESLNEQLKERKETLETFESELKFYRSSTPKEQDRIEDCHLKELGKDAVELISQEEEHKEEVELLKDEVKSLSEEIIHVDVNQKSQLQSTKLSAANSGKKHKELSEKLQEKIKSKQALQEAAVLNKIDLESSLNEFRELTVSLKKMEDIQNDNIRFVKTLDQEETMMHQKEMNLFKIKLDHVNHFQMKLSELDTEIKELVKIVEDKYLNTVRTLKSCHSSEIKLNQLESDSSEQHNIKEAMKFKEKIKELEQSKESLEREIRLKTVNFEMEIQALKNQTENIAVELLKNEGMLAVKMEIEDTLVQRVSQLESLLAFKKDSFQEELGNAMSKCIAIETLLSAKMEIIDENEIMKNENISQRFNEQIDHIENVCLKVEEFFKKMDCLHQIVYDMKNSENYSVLKDKFEFFILEFNEIHSQTRILKEEFDKLYKAHFKLIAEKENLSENYQKIKGERHQLLINYKLSEENIKKFASLGYNIEDLYKMINVNSAIQANSHVIFDINYCSEKDIDQLVSISDIPGNFHENFIEKGNKRNERERWGDESVNEKDEIAEKGFTLREKEKMKQKNEKRKENVIVLSKSVDNLTNETNLDEMRESNQTLICELDLKDDVTVVSQKLDTIRENIQSNILSEDKCSLKSGNTELKLEIEEMEKENFIAIRGCGNFLREEMMVKLESVTKKICEVINEKNILVDNFENLDEERNKLKTELGQLRSTNDELRSKFDSELRQMSEQMYTVLMEELSSKEFKISEMKNEIRKLNDCMKTLGYELDLVEINSENLLSESPHQIKSNRSLKDELEEACSQECEIKDQLMKLQKENAVLNFHRNQLEQTNKKIYSLLSEGTPMVVSWSHIHEMMEKIFDVVHALKTSFKDLNPTLTERWNLPSSKSNSAFRNLPELHIEYQNKRKLCRELILQKNILEKELESLENIIKQSCKIQKQETEHLDEDSVQKLNCFSEDGDDHIPQSEEDVEVKDILLYSANCEKSETEPLKKDCYKEEIHCDHETELEKLRDILKEIQETGSTSLLLHEIEFKHTEEMEELRRYFEQKCAELEKNYSEEIFSQHSLKIYSDSDITENGEVEDVDAMNDFKLNDCDNKEDIVEKYRAVLDQEEEDSEKKLKFLKYITEIVNAHSKELNCMKTKHTKEKANLQQRYMLELKKLNEDLLITKKTAELEKELLIKSYENLINEIGIEERKIIAVDLRKELENRIKIEIKNFSKLLRAEKLALEKETVNLEELCVEKLSLCETERALKKIETEKEWEKRISKRNEENFKKELEEEKIKIAQHYKELNKAVLQKCNEEQENLIRSHSEITHKLIKEHEERISELKKAHKQDLEKLYCDEELKKLFIEFRKREKRFENEISSIKTSYEDELYELKKSCQETLNEQVSLAKVDAFNTLQKQIQSYLEGGDQNLSPSKEVVELSEKFAGKYRREIKELKERHHGEVTRIRSEYEEKIRRRYSTGSLPKKSIEKMEMRTDDDKLKILRERDALQEMVSSLRHILSELIRYVGSCEDELNSTIVGEFGKSEETLYRSFHMDTSELNETDCSSFLSKKVHFTPDLSNIIGDINDNKSLNTSLQVRMELDKCLKQLKSDASHLLALSNPGRKQDENMYELLRKMEEEKNGLAEKVICIEEMQQNLKMELNKTKNKLTELERSRETISEGYGEVVVSSEESKTLIPFKERAKALMLQNCNQSSDVLSLVEEICKEGDRLQDEARREKNDLQQQVVAAEKQLRSMRKFLEEQAAERESERDEYMSEIENFRETLKIRERDKSLQDRMSQEVHLAIKRNLIRIETLETQLKEANMRTTEIEQDKTFVENQLKEAVDKIWSLRDIITNLENQVATISMRESKLHCKLEELENINHHHVNINRDLMVELEAVKAKTQDEYSEHIKAMEQELSDLRHATERLSTEAVCQMRINLREIELSLSKKTKDLEQLYMSSANVSCSSPSEDISICDRLDATGCPTPDEMQNSGETQKMVLPLEEINRIHEKLTRHTRAEEIIIKMIKDSEIQLKSSKKAFEEIRIERDVLLERADNYLQENSRLKIRLDEQRCNATLIQKQLNADLEAQIKRLELDIEKLNDLCNQKDKQLRDITNILEQTTKSLKIREKEALNKSNEENELIINLKTELHNALDENKKLEENMKKMKETIRETVTVPLLIDKMLEEKNAEIDRLEKEVSNLSKIRATSSLIRNRSSTDSDGSNIKCMKRVKFSKPDSFVQFISPILAEDQSILRCASDSYTDLKISSFKLRKPVNWTAPPESLSSIGALQLSPRGHDSSMSWNNNNFILMSSPKEEEKGEPNENVVSVQGQVSQKTMEIRKYESGLSERGVVDAEIDEIRDQLNSMMTAVEQDKLLYKKEFEKMLQNESRLQTEIDSKRQEISEHLLEIDTLKRKLAEVNLDLGTVKSEYQRLENEMHDKNDEIRKANGNIENFLITIETLKRNHLEEVEELQNKLNFEHNRVESVLDELKILEVKKVEIEEEFLSLKEDYNEKLNSEQKTVLNLKSEINDLHRKNREANEKYEELEVLMESTLRDTNKLSQDLTEELSKMKSENDKLKSDYLVLKNNLDSCINQIADKKEIEVQVEFENNNNFCQPSIQGETTLIPLGKAEFREECHGFQNKIDKLKLEIYEWERKMDEGDMQRDDILSYVALIRTLISSITENLDNHFYELQTYRRKMMECSVDDLTDRVQKELLLSAKLDNNLLSNLHSANLSQTEVKNSSDVLEDHELFPEIGSGDQDKCVTKKKQNLVNLTVKLYELETNLQEMEERNKEFEHQITELKNERNEEKKRADGLQILAKLLEDGLSKEKEKLAEEKSRYDEDAKLMEVLRINFEMILEKADELEKALSIEKQHRMSLEKQLKLAQEPNNPDVDITSELMCKLEIERKRNSSLSVNIEKEKRKCQELKIQLEQEKLERMTEKDVQRLMNKDLTLLQEQKNNLDSQLLYARELLLTREAEIVALKRKLNLQEIDIKALTISNESQIEKETEMSMMVEKIGRLEEEVEFYREQIQTLKEKSDSISAPLLIKMKTLCSCVQQHVQESNVMGEALLHLTQEMDQMQTFIKKLEETTENKGETMTNSSEDTILADFEMERKLFSEEKEKLKSELEKAKCDYEVLKKDSLDIFKSNDSLKLEIKKLNKEVEMLKDELEKAKHQVGIPEDRVLHLFGKYMRTESYRKALAYQKMYLTKVVKGYEAADDEIRISRGRRRELKKKKSPKTKKKFKRVLLVVIAIKRMQFMVSRWRLGRVSGFNALMAHCDAVNLNKDNEFRTHSPTSLQIGPINPLRYLTQNLGQQQRPQTQANILRTPPSRDLDSHQNSAVDMRKIIENIQRFNYLQKNLGLPSRPPWT